MAKTGNKNHNYRVVDVAKSGKVKRVLLTTKDPGRAYEFARDLDFLGNLKVQHRDTSPPRWHEKYGHWINSK